MTSGWSKEAGIRNRGIDRVELRVIEDVESLPAKLKRFSFADEKALEQSYVEVRPEWIIQTVAARIAERQPSWDSKGRGIEKHRSAVVLLHRGRVLWISDNIQERSHTIAVSYSGVVVPINYAEGLTRLKQSDT